MFKENLANFLENMPKGILEEEKKALALLLGKDKLSEAETKQAVDFARRAYPHIFAYFKVFNSCCRKKEEAGIHKLIKEDYIREHFDKFITEGGDIEKIRQGRVEEEYLTSEDVEVFKKAEAKMHEEVAEETCAEIVGARKAEFDEYVKTGEDIVKKVEEKITALRNMASDAPEWSVEIFGKIAELDGRWLNIGNEPSEQDVNELLDYFGSVVNIQGE